MEKWIGFITAKIDIAKRFKVANVNRGKVVTTMEGFIFYAHHAFGDSDGGNAAIRESIVSNACHAFGDGDIGDAAAIRESRLSNACHAFGDGDVGEVVAKRESRISNARHAILLTLIGHRGGDGDGVGVFIIVFIIATAFESNLGCLALGTRLYQMPSISTFSALASKGSNVAKMNSRCFFIM